MQSCLQMILPCRNLGLHHLICSSGVCVPNLPKICKQKRMFSLISGTGPKMHCRDGAGVDCTARGQVGPCAGTRYSIPKENRWCEGRWKIENECLNK